MSVFPQTLWWSLKGLFNPQRDWDPQGKHCSLSFRLSSLISVSMSSFFHLVPCYFSLSMLIGEAVCRLPVSSCCYKPGSMASLQPTSYSFTVRFDFQNWEEQRPLLHPRPVGPGDGSWERRDQGGVMVLCNSMQCLLLWTIKSCIFLSQKATLCKDNFHLPWGSCPSAVTPEPVKGLSTPQRVVTLVCWIKAAFQRK